MFQNPDIHIYTHTYINILPVLIFSSFFLSFFWTVQAYVFQMNSGECAAFLVNNGKRRVNVHFNSFTYDLPQKSISILPDCNTTVFNTAKVRLKCTKFISRINNCVPVAHKRIRKHRDTLD